MITVSVRALLVLALIVFGAFKRFKGGMPLPGRSNVVVAAAYYPQPQTELATQYGDGEEEAGKDDNIAERDINEVL